MSWEHVITTSKLSPSSKHLHLDRKHRYRSPYLSSSKTFHLKGFLLAAQSTWLTSSFYQGLGTGSMEYSCNAFHTETVKGRILFIHVNFMGHSFLFFFCIVCFSILSFLKHRFFFELCETATLKTMTTLMSNCHCADS